MSRAPAPDPVARTARAFVVTMGLVAMFGDMTYEGARGLVGPWLGLLGASAVAVGFAAGLGEFLGYALRLATGWLGDRTRAWWPLVIAGYAVNLVAVPGLALVGSWQAAAALVVLERVGKAVRSPAKSTLVSYASSRVGAGWSFGLDEALDQLGAVTGPLLTAGVMWGVGGLPDVRYRAAFAVLLLPVLGNLALVLLARRRFPDPEAFEGPEHPAPVPAPLVLRVYTVAAGLIAVGFSDWALVAWHAGHTGALGPEGVPVVYAAVMAADAVAALVLGPLFDRVGLLALAVGATVGALYAPLVFLAPSTATLVVGALLWGVGMGTQEALFKAAIAKMVPKAQRGRAYGVFFAWFGAAWWAGSTLLGALYEVSLPALVAVALGAQAAAVPLLVWVQRRLP